MKRFIPVWLLFLFVVLTTTASANPVSDISRYQAEADLKADLMQRYGSSYNTILMLLDARMKAYDELCQVEDDPVNKQILEDLLKRYYPSFSTIQMLFKSNREAYDRLNR